MKSVCVSLGFKNPIKSGYVKFSRTREWGIGFYWVFGPLQRMMVHVFHICKRFVISSDLEAKSILAGQLSLLEIEIHYQTTSARE